MTTIKFSVLEERRLGREFIKKSVLKLANESTPVIICLCPRPDAPKWEDELFPVTNKLFDHMEYVILHIETIRNN